MKKLVLFVGMFILVCSSSVLVFAENPTSGNQANQEHTVQVKDTVIPKDTTKVPSDTTKVPTIILNN